MGLTTVVSCDVCSSQKGADNHWWIAWTSHEDGVPEMHVAALKFPSGPDVMYLCGEQCVTKTVSKFMRSGGSQ